MKAMKGRILKKLKSMPHIGDLKQGRVLHLKASDGFFFHSHPSPPLPTSHLQDCREIQPEFMNAAELMRDLDEGDKENIKPPPTPRNPPPWRKRSQDEPNNHKISPFRRPDLNSTTLFDPNLLAAFEQAVKSYLRNYEESMSSVSAQMLEEEEEPPAKRVARSNDLMNGFDERCLPGGSGAVVFYTTSLRGVRKTFEDCSAIRFLLESSKVLFYERDVSMHREFRKELQRVLGLGVIPPRLFVDGRYIGGAEEVLGLHEQGRLMPVLMEMPVDQSGGVPCWRCSGARFLVCERCDGGRKIYDDDGGLWKYCGLCNENGLVVCHLCCC